MALFGLGKEKSASDTKAPAPKNAAQEKKQKVPPKETFSAPASHTSISETSHVLKNPRITEKATAHSESGIYTFDVAERATKQSVSRAVFDVYRVKPRMIRIVVIRSKVRRNIRTGKRGISRGGKKAYVYLKKGDVIALL